eukprot:TRINITY_DN4775_c0_g1_i2.p1 TRINITY_DN4775_c0_g1~~TRINITY_DN4775_c0_g1_i2.p1  ORF type:complete len:586 (-),score=54.45 TRINITY_DN4775_c0_g1_i2:544-2301(-)
MADASEQQVDPPAAEQQVDPPAADSGTVVTVVKAPRSWRKPAILVGSCCCCFVCIIGIALGIVAAVLAPKEIEEYAVCQLNLCGHEPGPIRLERYIFQNFSSFGPMDDTCMLAVDENARAGKDLVLYVEFWLRNPNGYSVDVETFRTEFSRARGAASQDVQEGRISLCETEAFVLSPGDQKIRLRCTVASRDKPFLEQAIVDYLRCREITILQEYTWKASLGGISTGLQAQSGPTTTLNSGNSCLGKQEVPGWLGGQGACLGTTDVRAEEPSIWLCSVRLTSVSNPTLQLELEINNPTTFEVSISSINLLIHGGSTGNDLIARVHNDGTPIVVPAKTQIDVLLTASITSITAASAAMRLGMAKISGEVNVSFLGLTLINAVVPTTSVNVTDQIANTGGQLTLSTIITSGLYGYAFADCECVYGCDGIDKSSKTCSKYTGGTCAFSSCDASRQARCLQGRCVCADGTCAVGGGCVSNSTMCNVYTGGACRFTSCSTSRQAQCLQGNCVCGDGACAVAGQCVPRGTASAPAPSTTSPSSISNSGCSLDTGGTCRVSSCYSSRNATCQSRRCLCGAGTCAVGGACVQH